MKEQKADLQASHIRLGMKNLKDTFKSTNVQQAERFRDKAGSDMQQRKDRDDLMLLKAKNET